ncbi:DUF4031 domain-containing protein [Ruania albidiflava]|uniref:DUF4031 domain-containing protein n=1 Tax=Ruania albidiflava TaxID=366586 RepID=UPI0003B66097|nr:DUF4031 domain-containing protein [Ruania albidiflava]
MILIDPPMWPAHRTRFSHLVSDHTLAELHQFAAAAGLAERAFDADHYDVPAERHDELVQLGAQPVSAGELIRRLRRSGLRLPARDRPQRARAVLEQRWAHTLAAQPGLGTQLLHRWSEPHRRYHTTAHLLDVLSALDLLCAPAVPPRTVRLAAWFHDAIYTGVAGVDEEDSADLAERALPQVGLAATEVSEVVRLVLLTRSHSPVPQDRAGALLCDADLAVLGRDPDGYARYQQQVRAEYAHVSEPDWRTGRSAVLQHLLDRRPLFRTPTGAAHWEQRARANLQGELAQLQR